MTAAAANIIDLPKQKLMTCKKIETNCGISELKLIQPALPLSGDTDTLVPCE